MVAGALTCLRLIDTDHAVCRRPKFRVRAMCSFLHQHSALVITFERVTTLWWNTVQVILVQKQSLKKKTYCTTTELGPRRCKYCTSSIHPTIQHHNMSFGSQTLKDSECMLDWLTRIEERQTMDSWKKETESRIVLTERSGTVEAGRLCTTGTNQLRFL